MILFHCTTPAKMARYAATGGILPPVRGWRFRSSAEAWGKRCHRPIILEIDVPTAHPLPDHRPLGHAWWHDGMVREWTVVTP